MKNKKQLLLDMKLEYLLYNRLQEIKHKFNQKSMSTRCETLVIKINTIEY